MKEEKLWFGARIVAAQKELGQVWKGGSNVQHLLIDISKHREKKEILSQMIENITLSLSTTICT